MQGNGRNGLKEIREHEGITISELSRLSGVSEKTIRDIEAKRANPTRITKNKIVNGVNRNSRKTMTYTIEEIFPERTSDIPNDSKVSV